MCHVCRFAEVVCSPFMGVPVTHRFHTSSPSNPHNRTRYTYARPSCNRFRFSTRSHTPHEITKHCLLHRQLQLQSLHNSLIQLQQGLVLLTTTTTTIQILWVQTHYLHLRIMPVIIIILIKTNEHFLHQTVQTCMSLSHFMRKHPIICKCYTKTQT